MFYRILKLKDQDLIKQATEIFKSYSEFMYQNHTPFCHALFHSEESAF